MASSFEMGELLRNTTPQLNYDNFNDQNAALDLLINENNTVQSESIRTR